MKKKKGIFTFISKSLILLVLYDKVTLDRINLSSCRFILNAMSNIGQMNHITK